MYIDFQTPGTWFDLNEAVAEQLSFDPSGLQVRCYAGVNDAVLEVTQALVKQFPHKKKVYYFSDISPGLVLAMQSLSRDGVQVEALHPQELLSDAKKWSEIFSADTLFVLWSADHPVLGSTHPDQDLRDFLLQKKIFSLIVSHRLHSFARPPEKLERPRLRFLSLSPKLCLVLSHPRLRFVTPLAENRSWSLQETQSSLPKALGDQAQDPQKVKDFEALGVAQSQAAFDLPALQPLSQQRLFDRAVIYWEDMDGEAVIRLLAKRRSHTLHPPGLDPFLETASLTRWGGVRTMDWLESLGLTKSQLRGLVLLDLSLIDSSLKEDLEEVRFEVLRLQGGHGVSSGARC